MSSNCPSNDLLCHRHDHTPIAPSPNTYCHHSSPIHIATHHGHARLPLSLTNPPAMALSFVLHHHQAFILPSTPSTPATDLYRALHICPSYSFPYLKPDTVLLSTIVKPDISPIPPLPHLPPPSCPIPPPHLGLSLPGPFLFLPSSFLYPLLFPLDRIPSLLLLPA